MIVVFIALAACGDRSQPADEPGTEAAFQPPEPEPPDLGDALALGAGRIAYTFVSPRGARLLEHRISHFTQDRQLGITRQRHRLRPSYVNAGGCDRLPLRL